MPFRPHSVQSGYGPSGTVRTLYRIVTVQFVGFSELLTLNYLSLAHNYALALSLLRPVNKGSLWLR